MTSDRGGPWPPSCAEDVCESIRDVPLDIVETDGHDAIAPPTFEPDLR